MNQILLTIVIPAYNSEKDLPRCLDSLIVEEVLDKVEVLIVNDGSKDRTLEIAKNYEKKYPGYFHAIDKENGNYGSVMNKGLSLAKGKYFRTLDSDDWMRKDGLEKLINALQTSNADLVLTEKTKHYQLNNHEELFSFDKTLPLNKDVEIDDTILKNPSVGNNMVVMSMCYKTTLLEQCFFRWSEKVFYTDNEYCYFPMKHVHTIRLVSAPLYIYFIGKDEQSTSEISLKRNFHSFDVVTNRIVDDYLSDQEKHVTQKVLDGVLYRVLRYFYSYVMMDGLVHRKEIMALDEKLKKSPSIYREVAQRYTFRNINVIDSYRKSLYHPKFILAQLIKRTLENNTIRGILGLKKIYKGIA